MSKKIIKNIKTKDLNISGDNESLVECSAICDNCSIHLSCGYKRGVF